MTNKIIITALTGVVALLAACSSEVKRTPGKIYMPDMAYSRAYETYADHSNLAAKGIHYDARPVAGTVARSQNYVYHTSLDSVGQLTNYEASNADVNPVTMLTEIQMVEAERLYLVNCAICHGTKLDGNGPLWKDGAGPYPAKPATLVGDAVYEAMSEGKMFYSVTYGKNLMGPYGSQLSAKQRWDIIHYVKVKQGKKSNGTAGDPTAAPAAATDTTKAASVPPVAPVATAAPAN